MEIHGDIFPCNKGFLVGFLAITICSPISHHFQAETAYEEHFNVVYLTYNNNES